MAREPELTRQKQELAAVVISLLDNYEASDWYSMSNFKP